MSRLKLVLMLVFLGGFAQVFYPYAATYFEDDRARAKAPTVIISKPTEATLLASGIITTSIEALITDLHIPQSIIDEALKALSYQTDLQHEITKGTIIEILYTRSTPPRLHYVSIENALVKQELFAWKNKYYSAEGRGVQGVLLRTPIYGARISSKFGKRKHPILGYTKMHKGIDFAAPTGTPIYAAGDGTITYAAKKGGYGNYIKIKHSDTYRTAYAHMHSFADGVGKGSIVRQGDIIGYVGSTGRSTGPHLHYEVIESGTHINPKNVTLDADILANAELDKYNSYVKQVSVYLE